MESGIETRREGGSRTVINYRFAPSRLALVRRIGDAIVPETPSRV